MAYTPKQTPAPAPAPRAADSGNHMVEEIERTWL